MAPLVKLVKLDLSANQITNLQPLELLNNLEQLTVSDNLIHEIAPPGPNQYFLPSLRYLDLRNNPFLVDAQFIAPTQDRLSRLLRYVCMKEGFTRGQVAKSMLEAKEMPDTIVDKRYYEGAAMYEGPLYVWEEDWGVGFRDGECHRII